MCSLAVVSPSICCMATHGNTGPNRLVAACSITIRSAASTLLPSKLTVMVCHKQHCNTTNTGHQNSQHARNVGRCPCRIFQDSYNTEKALAWLTAAHAEERALRQSMKGEVEEARHSLSREQRAHQAAVQVRAPRVSCHRLRICRHSCLAMRWDRCTVGLCGC